VVVPDNVLFEGGAGETVRRRLLQQFDVHTLRRLPTGIFHAGGVKANVLFFGKRPARPEAPWTSTLWVYDFRTGQHFTLKQSRLRRQDLDDVVACYRPGEPRKARQETERFRPFPLDELLARGGPDRLGGGPARGARPGSRLSVVPGHPAGHRRPG
jgi:type I restriction enzyme M protein